MKTALIGNFGHRFGLGHLFRLYSLQTFLKEIGPIICYSNDEEKKMLSSLNLECKKLDEISPDKIVFDGYKLDKNKKALIKEVNFINRYSIDTVENIDLLFGTCIIPSFYISRTNLKKAESNFSNFSYGADYFFIKANKSTKPKFKNTLVTIGGSDPNSITASLAKILGDDASYMIGPAFDRRHRDKIRRIVKSENIIEGSTETFKHIAKANLVISAIGTTLQEIEMLKKNCILVSNYTTDEDHFNSILRCSKNPKNYIFHGHFRQLNKSKLKREMLSFDTLEINEHFNVKKHNKEAKAKWLHILQN